MNKFVKLILLISIFQAGCALLPSDGNNLKYKELENQKVKIKAIVKIKCSFSRDQGRIAKVIDCESDYLSSFQKATGSYIEIVSNDSKNYDEIIDIKYSLLNDNQGSCSHGSCLLYLIWPGGIEIERRVDWTIENSSGKILNLNESGLYKKYGFFLLFPIGLYQFVTGGQDKIFEELNQSVLEKFLKSWSAGI